VLYSAHSFYAIEVKRCTQVCSENAHGLRAFLEDYLEATAILLYMGEWQMNEGATICISGVEFTQSLTSKDSFDQ